MPIYEYQCEACNQVHEIVQKFSDPPLASCPECGRPVRKLMSLSSFALKGSGWYTTDYKRAGAAAKAKAEPEGKSAAAKDGAVAKVKCEGAADGASNAAPKPAETKPV